MNLAVQHLSDEAVAAYADGMLATPAHNRATRHIVSCAECASAVDEQRAAVAVLRRASVPMVPQGLLDRLRAVPTTTPLTSKPVALAPDGSAVFAAFGTSAAFLPTSQPPSNRPGSVPSHQPMAAVALLDASIAANPGFSERVPFHFPVAVPRRVGRRTQQLALVTAAAAMITVGVAASAAANTTGSNRSPQFAPGAGSTQQVVTTVRRTDSQLQSVNAVTGRR